MKSSARTDSKNEDPFDMDDSKFMVGNAFRGMLRFLPRRAASKRGKKAVKRPARATSAR